MRGVTVKLVVKTQTGKDALNMPVYEENIEEVENVLVGSPTTDDINNGLSLYGKTITYTLAIPKGDTRIWEDTEVILPEPFGGRYHTIGYPEAGIESLIPLSWNRKVHLERIEDRKDST